MKKITGVLSALLGAAFAASITLNFCFYHKFSAEKNARTRQLSAGLKKVNKNVQNIKNNVSPSLALRQTGRYGYKTVYARFNADNLDFTNLSKDLIVVKPALPFTVGSDPCGDHIKIRADFQPETVYQILIRRGLETATGGRLEYDAEFRIGFPALPASLKALSGGLIFPAKRINRMLPLELCNLDAIQVTVLKLYENNLLRFSAQTDWSGSIKALDYGKETASKTIPVKMPRNKTVNYALDLAQLIPVEHPGTYGLILTPMDRKKTGNSVQLAVSITDLAPQCVIDNRGKKAFAVVRKLSDGSACPGAEVTLVSSKFQTLASGRTDASGIIRLDYRNSNAGADPKDYPNALLVKYGKDLAFQQELFWKGHSLAEFESLGNMGSLTPRALVYPERGVYRPGEKVFVTAWVRDPDLKICANAPCLMKILDPSGNVIYSRLMKTSADGWIHTVFTLPENLSRGKYTIWCQAADESHVWGYSGFLAADFMPDRIKVKLNPAASELFPEKPDTDFSFSAEYYFSGKMDQSPYQFTVSAAAAAPKPEWRGWTVGSGEFTAGRGLSRSGKMSEDAVKISYPGFAALGGKAYCPVALNAEARVSEPGGRAVTAHSTVIYHPTPYYIGLRQQSEKEQILLDWKFVPADKTRPVTLKNQKIELTIVREEWKYLLKKSHGRFSREWVKEKVPVSRETIDSAGLAGGSWRKKLDGGRYEITARCGNMRTTIAFWHWYGEGGARSANPAVLSCTMDKNCYHPGDTAKIILESAVDGFALIALGDLKLASCREYPVKKGRNELSLQLPADTQTCACYGGITLISGEQRQFGLVRFPLEQSRHQLKVSLDAPENAVPQSKIKVRVSLSSPDGQPQSGIVQLFAVDEGILALTRYAVPDIFKFFYGVYNCDFIFTDIYGQLYPDLKIDKNGRIGGDAAERRNSALAAFEKRRTDPRKTAAESAVTVLSPQLVNGSREFEISLPDHLGAMRLMAVASAPDRTGSAEQSLKIRDRLDILPSAPQVCSPGDETELTFSLLNHDLKDGKALFELTLPDGKKVSSEPILKQGKPVVFRIPVVLPHKEGVCTFHASLTKDGILKQKILRLPVRLPHPPVTETRLHTLKPGEKWQPLPGKTAAFAAGAKYTLAVSGSSAVVLKDAIDWLNQYPYGCLEQTVSGAFPFLCADALEKSALITPEMANTAKVKANLAAAKILSMMLYNGSFPMWQNGTEEWSGGTVYAAHFLTACGSLRDRKQKTLLAGYLKSLLQKAAAPSYERGYAAYVLALMKRNQTDFLTGARNLLKSGQDDFGSFLAAAALLQAGYSGEAYPHLKRLLKKEIWRLNDDAPHFARESARAGMTLYILLQLQADAPETVAKLRQTLLNALQPNGAGWGVTHDNAWAVLGLAELERHSAAAKGSAAVTLTDGRKIQPDLTRGTEIKLNGPDGFMVENTGNTPIYLQYRIQGIPVKSEPVRGALRLRREILRKGKTVHSAAQGDLLTVRIRIESTGRIQDLVLSDLLPGGLEIEDERFATRAGRSVPRPVKNRILSVKHQEKRFGEFVLCGDLLNKGYDEITYQVRAVTRGKYLMGSTAAEAMYDPQTRSFEHGNGFFEVK